MKKMLLGIVVCSLVYPIALVAQQQVCGMEKISSVHLRVPVTVQRPAGLKLATADVDEKGNIYVSCSVWQASQDGRRKTSLGPYLIRYDPTGKISNISTLPASLSQEAKILSIAYRKGKVYAAAQWHEQSAESGILVFDDSGKLDRVINLDGFDAYKVRLSREGDFYILGIPRENLSADSQMVLKLSPTGSMRASFSSVVGKTREEIDASLQLVMHNELLLDESGRVFHILPDGEVRIFSPSGTLIKTFKSDGDGAVTSAFWGDGNDIVINRTANNGVGGLFRVSAQQQEQPMCETGGRGLLPPMFKGADGYYYGIGHLGVSRSTTVTQLQFALAKYKKAQ